MITTARSARRTASAAQDSQSSSGSDGHTTSSDIPGQSVVREWVDELTGRTERAASGLRVPSDTEIEQLISMFPDMRREDVVRALQRR